MAKSSAIGKRGENQVVELLREYWEDPHFIRNWFGDSGAVGTQLAGNPNVPEYILEALTGDIVCPITFPFTVESKLYTTIDLYAIMRNPENCDVVSFWNQCKRDSERINKIPLVIMREKGRGKEPHAIFRKSDVGNSKITTIDFVSNNEIVSIARWNDFTKYYPKSNF